MYSEELNQLIQIKYKDYKHITEEFSEFHSHISDLSPSLFNALKSKEKIREADLSYWLKKIESLKEIPEITLSFIIICKDEEKNIQKCLESILSQSQKHDEIIVVDTGSHDKTKEIVLNSYNKKVKLINLTWNDDFAEIRNTAIIFSNKKWIFFVDADEWIEEGGIASLKKNLKIIEWYNFTNLVVSPTIVNSNGHSINCVRRIFRKCEGITYFGLVHEEPRKFKGESHIALTNIAFDNVVLNHSGYELEVIREKDKVNRNYTLLKKMIKIEPQNPRWKYFLCRDCSDVLKKEIYEHLLLESLMLCGQKYDYIRYKIGILTELCQLYLKENNIEKYMHYIHELESIAPNLSNVVYLNSLQKFNHYHQEMCKLRNHLIAYRNSKRVIEYGGMHSNYFHIDLVIGQLLFATGKYRTAFNILEYLENRQYGKFKFQFQELYEELSKFMNN